MNRIRLTASASALAAALLLSPTVVSAQDTAARVETRTTDNDDNDGFDKGLLGLLGLIGLAGLRRRPEHAHVHVDRDVTTGPANYGSGGTPGTRRP